MARNTLAVRFPHFPEASSRAIGHEVANALAICCYESPKSCRVDRDSVPCKQPATVHHLESEQEVASITSGRIAMRKFPISAAFVAEFQRLCEARDLAAYRVVGCLESAIHACRLGKASEAVTILHRAKSSLESADHDLETFGVKNGIGTAYRAET